MKKINFCKATTIILIINVILSIVLFFVVPDNIATYFVYSGGDFFCTYILTCLDKILYFWKSINYPPKLTE